MNCTGKKTDERYIQVLSYLEPPTLEIAYFNHFNHRDWKNYTCLHSQFKIVKYLCFMVRECKQNFCPLTAS